jgi:hypothetical protein
VPAAPGSLTGTLPVISVPRPVSQPPVLQYFEFALQETPNQRFVDHLYQDLFHTIPPVQTIITLGTKLDQGMLTPLAVAQQFTFSQAYGMTVVQDLFQSMLHRAYNPAIDQQSGLTSVVNTYLSNLSEEGLNPAAPSQILTDSRDNLAAAIAWHAEYYNTRGGGTDAGWLTALYMDALHRAPTPAELAAYHSIGGGNLVNAGPNYTTADQVFASTERLQVEVTDFYQHFLHRQPEPAGLTFWVNRIQSGISIEEVIAEIGSSPEYLRNVQYATPIVAAGPFTNLGTVQLTT